MRPRLSDSHLSADALTHSDHDSYVHVYPPWFVAARAAFEPDFQALVSAIAGRPGLPSLIPDAVNPGRRIRPALFCALSAATTGSCSSPTDLLPALALELFHAASIVVDDIADGEERRRDKAAFFRLYDQHTAVVLSHLLIAEGASLLIRHPAARPLLGAWSRAYSEAAQGQALDLRRFNPLNALEQQQLSLRKTSAFFVFIADALAAASGEDLGDLSDLLRDIGECFQISNDVVDMLYFGRAGRHEPAKSYVLRPSYLVPRLMAAGLLDPDHVFKPLPFVAHQKLSEAARQLIPDAHDFLVRLFDPLGERVAAARLSPGHRTILSDFLAQTTYVSFWLHTHGK